MATKKARTMEDMEYRAGLEYFVVIFHKSGAMPRMLTDPQCNDVATFDTETEAKMVAKRIAKTADYKKWQFTICKLRD